MSTAQPVSRKEQMAILVASREQEADHELSPTKCIANIQTSVQRGINDNCYFPPVVTLP